MTKLTDKRQAHLGRYLLEINKSFLQMSVEQLADAGFDDLQPHHIHTFAHIHEEGSTIAEIIEQASVSKQAVSNTLKYLEEKGYIKKKANPEDQRAKKIYFTKKGENLIKEGMDGIKEIESYYESMIGKRKFSLLMGILEDIYLQEKVNKES